jgi:hypothetical protein
MSIGGRFAQRKVEKEGFSEIRSAFSAGRAEGGSNVLFNCPDSLRPDSYELNPDTDTSKTIANFSTSLNFDVGSRQAKSKINDRAFGKMCRSVYEHAVGAYVWRTNWDACAPSFVSQVEFAQL